MIDPVYVRDGDALVIEVRHFDMKGWPPCEPKHYGPILLDCFNLGGKAYGAFDGETLIGATMLENRLIGRGRDQFQLKFLRVSRRHRRSGLGSALFGKAVGWARELGAHRLYISSTSSENTARLDLRRGCRVADDADAAAFELEPEDIHLKFDIPV